MTKELNLEKDILNIVEQVFSKKEEASQKQGMQDALTESANTIEALTSNLETLQADNESAATSYKEELASKESKITDLSTELEAAQQKTEELTIELATVSSEIDDMKKDKVAEARMAELIEAKVKASAGEDKQFAKVKEMSDEEFAAYKAERVELRTAVAKELADSQAAADALALSSEKTATDTVVEGEEAASGGKESASTNTPPAEIGHGQAMAAAMNLESIPSDDIMKKYAELGKAMASSFVPESDK